MCHNLVSLAKADGSDVVINGEDMLPKNGDLFKQGDFNTGYLAGHFSEFEKAKGYYLCFLGNYDLGVYDDILSRTESRFSHVIYLAQRSFKADGYEFIGMNYVIGRLPLQAQRPMPERRQRLHSAEPVRGRVTVDTTWLPGNNGLPG